MASSFISSTIVATRSSVVSTTYIYAVYVLIYAVMCLKALKRGWSRLPMAYEEEDTCMSHEEEDKCMSYEEEDTCMSYEEEDTCMSYEEEDTYLVPRFPG